LGVVCQAGRDFGHADWKAALYLERFWIEYNYFGSVLAVDVDHAVGPDYGLFTVAFGFNGSGNVAGCGVDDGNIMGSMIVGEYALSARIVVNAVRASAHVDLLDELER